MAPTTLTFLDCLAGSFTVGTSPARSHEERGLLHDPPLQTGSLLPGLSSAPGHAHQAFPAAPCGFPKRCKPLTWFGIYCIIFWVLKISIEYVSFSFLGISPLKTGAYVCWFPPVSRISLENSHLLIDAGEGNECESRTLYRGRQHRYQLEGLPGKRWNL